MKCCKLMEWNAYKRAGEQDDRKRNERMDLASL